METIPVLIVGAGPSGLVFALSLAKYKIPSIILEKEDGITDDPRGVYLAGDACRVLWRIGLGESMPWIGHEVDDVFYHRSTFKSSPFLRIPITHDWMGHAIPNGILQSQPKLEHALRCLVEKSEYCTLRTGSEVIDREELATHMVVTYLDHRSKTKKHLRAQWLIGADGKRGVVRKKFLEPTAGIKQEDGIFRYEGTWIAANLHMTLPTPATHPDLDVLWDLGLTAEEVYDLFWPKGWHFCAPPGKPTACGRFGPHEDRLWRHEFAEPDWSDDGSKNAEELFWEHLTPMITLSADATGRQFGREITFPKDCIEIMRCRPFKFTHKVVNRWFDNRTILIGDAAHVFPPFGGQGIACGIRDAEELSWRIAILASLKSSIPQGVINGVLSAWAKERHLGVENSMRHTMISGNLCNGTAGLAYTALAPLLLPLLTLPSFRGFPTPLSHGEVTGYRSVKDGFFLSKYGGGYKLAQTYAIATFPTNSLPESSLRWEMVLSDQILYHVPTPFILLIAGQLLAEEKSQVQKLLRSTRLESTILSDQSIIQLHKSQKDLETSLKREITNRPKSPRYITWYPAPREQGIGMAMKPGYNPSNFLERIGGVSARYVLVRQDSIIFAAAKNLKEFEICLGHLEMMCVP